MKKLIGYARASTRPQDSDRQIEDLLAAGVRKDDLEPTGDSAAPRVQPGAGFPAGG